MRGRRRGAGGGAAGGGGLGGWEAGMARRRLQRSLPPARCHRAPRLSGRGAWAQPTHPGAARQRRGASSEKTTQAPSQYGSNTVWVPTSVRVPGAKGTYVTDAGVAVWRHLTKKPAYRRVDQIKTCLDRYQNRHGSSCWPSSAGSAGVLERPKRGPWARCRPWGWYCRWFRDSRRGVFACVLVALLPPSGSAHRAWRSA